MNNATRLAHPRRAVPFAIYGLVAFHLQVTSVHAADLEQGNDSWSELTPRQVVRNFRKELSALWDSRCFVKSSTRLCSVSRIPTDVARLQDMFTRFLRKTDPKSRKLTTGELVMLTANDRRGERNDAERRGGTLSFGLAPAGVQTSSDRYLRGKRIQTTLTMSAVPGAAAPKNPLVWNFGGTVEYTTDLDASGHGKIPRDWVLVHNSKTRDGVSEKDAHWLLYTEKKSATHWTRRQQVRVRLYPEDYSTLMGARVDRDTFESALKRIARKQRQRRKPRPQEQSRWQELYLALSSPRWR